MCLKIKPDVKLADILSVFKKAKCFSLAPIEVEILLCRGSAQKIATESGTMLAENANLSASKINNQFRHKTIPIKSQNNYMKTK